jgi:NAD(P)-dependent dehydrogenase (short-subunit alcohol dehydrogenase family)
MCYFNAVKNSLKAADWIRAVLLPQLASPVARYITGTVIPVDGGLRRYQF